MSSTFGLKAMKPIAMMAALKKCDGARLTEKNKPKTKEEEKLEEHRTTKMRRNVRLLNTQKGQLVRKIRQEQFTQCTYTSHLLCMYMEMEIALWESLTVYACVSVNNN